MDWDYFMSMSYILATSEQVYYLLVEYLQESNALHPQVCGQVALAAVDRFSGSAGGLGGAGSGSGFRGGLDESLMEGIVDDEDDAAGRPATPAAPRQSAPLPEQASAGSQSMRLGTAPRLRTRLFAAQ